MNNTFDFSRFKKVLVKDLRNLVPTFGRVLLGLALLPMAFWLLNLLTEPFDYTSAETRQFYIIAIATITLALAPSFVYGNCNRMKKGIHFAMLPASKLEKYLSMIVVTLVVAPVAVMLAAALIDLLLTLLPFGSYREWLWSTQGTDYVQIEIAMMTGVDYTLFYLLVSAVSTGGLYMFTNTLFKKHKVISTILWCLLIGWVFSMVFMGVVVNNIENFEERVEAWAMTVSVEQFGARFYWIFTLSQLLVGIGFYVWGGLRLKKMRY